MSTNYNNTFLFILIILLLCSITLQQKENLSKIINKFEAIIDNVDLDKDQTKLYTSKEVSFNKQLFIIPIANTISSVEEYQFKEYFSRSNKDMLIGRLLVERFLGEESLFNDVITSLDGNYSINDYFTYDDKEIAELSKRSLNKHVFENRKANYENLLKKIPSSEIPSQMLNFKLYNWAASVVDCYGFIAQKIYYNDVKKIMKYSFTLNSFKENNLPLKKFNEEEILIIPGINIFKPGGFKRQYGNTFSSSLFAYKEHIYLNSDRFIEEGDELMNDVQFTPNTLLFESCGKVINDFYHEEVSIKIKNNDWTLIKYDLCKATDCISLNPNYKNPSKNINNPLLVLKGEFDLRLLNICEIDQMNFSDNLKENEDIFMATVRQIRDKKRISEENYMKALAKCSILLKDSLYLAKKTSLHEDLNILGSLINSSSNANTGNLKTILRYAISQKGIINKHLLIFRNRLIKEQNTQIFNILKNNYV